MIKCLLVDDDPLSRVSMETLCKRESDIKLVKSCTNVSDGLEVLKTEMIDVLFLDVEMPEATGFDLLDRFGAVPYVLMVSSKEQYAFDAFQYQVFDYLKKPVRSPRFKETMDRIRMEMKKEDNPPTGDQLFIKVDGRLVRLEPDNVLFVENVGDYVKFVTEDGNYLTYGTMKGIAEKLPQDTFLKVHRSYIVNLTKILDIEENTLVIKKSVIPISRAQKPILLSRINLI